VGREQHVGDVRAECGLELLGAGAALVADEMELRADDRGRGGGLRAFEPGNPRD